METTYSVNVNPNEKLVIKIASGNPLLTKGPGNSVRFYSTNNFVLHIENLRGERMAIITPGQEYYHGPADGRV